MIDKSIKIKSLKEHVVESISTVLWSEKFPACDCTPHGVLALVDEISSYHEEGKELFPHILLTTNLEGLLKSIPFTQKIVIKRTILDENEFNSALKLCAPLAVDGWIIFIEINVSDKKMVFGLLSSELSETSPSLHRQLIGDLSQGNIDLPFVYISNIGQRTVLIDGKGNHVAVSLSLKTIQDISRDSVKYLASCIAKDAKHEIRETIISYFEKLLNFSLKECHGTLIGVVEDNPLKIEFLKNCVEDGIYLEDPIDFTYLIENSENEKSRETSSMVRIYSSIIQHMLNFDGITVLSTCGKLIAYHCFIKQDSSSETGGGARSRAFGSMIKSKAFVCCLYKSQDGNERIWNEND
jgi:hypothetical protein